MFARSVTHLPTCLVEPVARAEVRRGASMDDRPTLALQAGALLV